MNCVNRDINLEHCNCTYPGCSKKGMCCLCIRYHRERGEIPACIFPDEIEKTFDRSVEKFIQTMR